MKTRHQFRAWDEKQKYMAVQGTPDLETIQSFIHHFGDKQLMQATGMFDKNGKEIYELDIVTYTVLSGSENGITGKDKKGRHVYQALVVFENGQFCGKEIRGDGSLTFGFPLSVLKKEAIVGNLYQRPSTCWLKGSIFQVADVIQGMPLPAESFDAEDFLQDKKDIWYHPRIGDRNNKESYDVAALMAEFANHYYMVK